MPGISQTDALREMTAAFRVRGEDSTSFLAAIVNSSQDAIITKTLDGTITSWNPGAEGIYGYTAEEAIGQSITFIAPPERKGEIGEFLRRIARGERVEHFETDRLHKDGRRLRISLTVSPIRESSGRIIGASAIARDITERRHAEVLLQEQLHLLELIAQSSPLEKVLESIVESVESCSQDELLASILLLDEDGKRLRHGAAPSLPQAYSEAIDGLEIGPEVGSCGTAAYSGETVIVEDIRTDPLWRDFRDLASEHDLRACWSTPILSGTREVLGTFALYYRQPRSPGSRDRTMLAIFSRVTTLALERHLTDERLRCQAEELAEISERKSDFLAVLGHELRNPLGAVTNAIALIDEAAGDPAVVTEAVGIVRRQTGHVARLVDDLLDVSRIGRGMLEIEREPVDLRDVVRRAVEIATPEIDARSQCLEIDLPAKPIHVEADPVRLGQVIANLLGNAAKYSDDGNRIELVVSAAGDEALVRVRDEGAGIDPCFLPHVFDLFARESESARSSPGLGLGLTLVRQLVELHGGEVSANSEGRGKGSELEVRLPVLQTEESEAEPETEEAVSDTQTTGNGPPMRVLLVDDHEEAVVALQSLLELWGHEVRVAFDGPAALAAAPEHQPDLVLLDIGLPQMDGWEVARRMRRMPEVEGAVLVALTGYGQEADREQSREAGFDHHVVKPIRPDQLRDHLTRWRSRPAAGA